MRCEAYSCINNDGEGYCCQSSYITIDENGECDSYTRRVIDLGLKHKNEGVKRVCRKCGSENLAVRKNAKNPMHTDLYCKECGAWQKFATADEIRLYSKPTINPETVPIVQELRKELERVTRERDALIWDMKVCGSGCYSCKHFDAPNGKCRASEPCGVNNNWEWRGIQEVQEDE